MIKNKFINKEHLGLKIKILRYKLGLSMEEFGKIFNATKGSVSGWESGKVIPNIERLHQMAEGPVLRWRIRFLLHSWTILLFNYFSHASTCGSATGAALRKQPCVCWFARHCNAPRSD